MKYSLTTIDDDVITCNFDSPIEINPQLYSIINHNISLMLPCTRDLNDHSCIRFDALGTVSLLEEIKSRDFDKYELFSFIDLLAEAVERIIAAGINENRIALDIANVYISTFDKSPKFICFPTTQEICAEELGLSAFFKDLILKVKSHEAYELIGAVIEQTSGDEFSPASFRQGIKLAMNGRQAERNAARMPESPAVTVIPAAADKYSPNTDQPDLPGIGREYIPEGVPVSVPGAVVKSADTDRTDKKTELLFAGAQDIGAVSYLSPVDNNSENARIYLVGRITIGRSSDNDLCINSATISGHHAEIVVSGKGCMLTDLGSTNKTYVNGAALKPNTPVLLKHQDVVSFNKNKYRYFDH